VRIETERHVATSLMSIIAGFMGAPCTP
jgi:hypothetical protein